MTINMIQRLAEKCIQFGCSLYQIYNIYPVCQTKLTSNPCDNITCKLYASKLESIKLNIYFH